MDGPKQPRSRFRWLFRFSLFALLLAMSCTAGYFSGYRWGAEQRAQDDYDTSVFHKVYYVADLVAPVRNPDEVLEQTDALEPDFDSLIDWVTSTVGSETWAANGEGEGEIRPYPSNLSIVVANTGAVHDQVADALQQLRDLRFKLPDDYLSQVRETLGRKLNRPTPIKVYRVIEPNYHQELENFFATALSDLTREYGRPSLVVSASDKAFPAWAAGQKIAVWNRWGGKLYLALQDCRPRGEALVAGWWEESFGAIKPIELAPRVLANVNR